jgi:hypothetical protein
MGTQEAIGGGVIMGRFTVPYAPTYTRSEGFQDIRGGEM